MVSLRVILVLHAMRELIPGRRESRHALVRCPRCQQESRLDLAEVLRYSTRLDCIARPGDQLRCEKCNGRLVRRTPPAPDDESLPGSVVELAKHRSLVVARLDEAATGDAHEAQPLLGRRR